jgi:hypothetical protein
MHNDAPEAPPSAPVSWQLLATVVTFMINVCVLVWGAARISTNLEHTQSTVTTVVQTQVELAKTLSDLVTQLRLQEYRLIQLEQRKK